MSRLLQEAVWFGSAGQEGSTDSEDESRKVVWSKVENGSGSGFADGLGPDHGLGALSRLDRTNAHREINVSKLFDAECLLL